MALETFKAQLKAKAKTLGVTNLSNKRIDAYAATLEKQNPNLSTDDDHSEKVDAFLELIDIKEIAAYDDYKATKKKDGKEKETTPTEPEKTSGTEPSPKQGGEDEMPAWFKKYQEDNDKKIEAILKKDQQESIHQKISSNEKIKDIPEVFWKKRIQPEKVEDVDAFIDEAVKDWEEIHPTEEGARRPALGGSGGGKDDGGGKKASKEELDAVMKEIM